MRWFAPLLVFLSSLSPAIGKVGALPNGTWDGVKWSDDEFEWTPPPGRNWQQGMSLPYPDFALKGNYGVTADSFLAQLMLFADDTPGYGAGWPDENLEFWKMQVVYSEEYEAFTTSKGYLASVIIQGWFPPPTTQNIGWILVIAHGDAPTGTSSVPRAAINLISSKPISLAYAKKFTDGLIFKNESSGGAEEFSVAVTSAPSSGGIVSGAGVYEKGTSFTLEAVSADGYRFKEWTGDASGSVNPLTLTADKAYSITAVFEVHFKVSTSSSPSSGGIVSGAGVYEKGTSFTLDAVPADGYRFKEWMGDASGSVNPLTLTADKAYSITAVFEVFPSKHERLLWQFQNENYFLSDPAISLDGTVYVGSEDKKVYALNGKTGAKLWESHMQSYVTTSPAIGSDGTVYVGSNDHKLYALNGKTGAKLWEFATGGEVWSSPAIGSDGTVYVGSEDKKVYALNGKTGAKLWEFATGDYVWSSPAIGSDGTVYVGSLDNKVYALNGATGEKKWEFLTRDTVTFSPTIGMYGTLYVGSDDNNFYALDGATGAKKWESSMPGYVKSSAAIGSDGTVYVGTYKGDGKVYALDGATGAKKWDCETGFHGSAVGKPVIGSDGTLYLVNDGLNAIRTDSQGPADSPWPMFGQNAQRTSRMKGTNDIENPPSNGSEDTSGPSRIKDALGIGNGWRQSDWLGYFWEGKDTNWVFHELIGWLYVAKDADADSYWLYSPKLGWLWLNEESYPYLYHAKLGWIYVMRDAKPATFWLSTPKLGWLRTEISYYPYFKPMKSEDWLMFREDSTATLWFYDYEEEIWVDPFDKTTANPSSGQDSSANKAGDTFTVPDLSLEMLWVEPGIFEMGSPTSETGRSPDETQHQVTLTNGFWLGKYEVTQAQWKKVMGGNPSYFKGANRPVERVSWNDVTSFCEKLTERESEAGRLPAGMAYQLPTDAQWEYACRAGTTTTFYWGNTASSTQANFNGNYPYGGVAVGPDLGQTAEVGQYAANPWGFHDMHGNVWEWTADWYGAYPTGAVSDPVGPADGSARVLRGGSWVSSALGARSAIRFRRVPARSSNSLGFRLSLRPASK